MNITSWNTVWQLIFGMGVLIFALLAVVVTYRGFREVLELLQGTQGTPEEAE